MARILLMHGVGSSAAVWWRVERDLADLGHDVATLDLLGHGGRTDGPDGPWSIEDLARDVLERAEPVDLLIGHSLGAIVALTAVALQPGFAGVVLLEDPPGGAKRDLTMVADVLEREAAATAADPEGAVASMLADKPEWAMLDATRIVAARAGLDLPRITAFLRGEAWAPGLLLREYVPPIHLLVATPAESALSEPVRSELIAQLGHRVTAVESGHSIYRDRPGLWLAAVIRILRG